MSSLTKLDFTPGIKAKDINNNFSIVEGWINRERRRVGGYGLVDGFELSTDVSNFTVTVAKGTMITPNGEEVDIAAETLQAGEPAYTERREQFVCPEDGIITLTNRPYSPETHKYIVYKPPVTTTVPADEIFYITCVDDGSRVFFVNISDKKVYISNASKYVGKTLSIKYMVTDDRIDSIILHSDGTYQYDKSIISTSPSHVDASDYADDDMLIGVIYWQVTSDGIVATTYDNHRSYRKVYVDSSNRLWLNGELYKKPQMIYLEEPEIPEENDFWYDSENNTLMIWKETNGDYGWVLVNDCSSITVRESTLIAPEDWPEDNQTFKFDDDEINLRFVPNSNALEIIIDNAILMSDQYTEIISKEHTDAPDYMAQGIGFKLKEPMDRATYIQVVVNHRVKLAPVSETFQRAAVFVAENYAYSDGTTNIFKTEFPYVVGAKQLDVFIDGERLVPDMYFQELKEDKTIPTDEEKLQGNLMSHYFKVIKPLTTGQVVDHKITKHVWSYDQVAQLLDDINTDIKNLKTKTDELATGLEESNKNVSSQIESVGSRVTTLAAEVAAQKEKGIADGAIKMTHLSDEVKKALIGTVIVNETMSATNIKTIAGIKSTDFVQVHLISVAMSRILMYNSDYTLADTPDGLRVDLSDELIVSGNTIYVTGFSIGRSEE